jgi:iron(III) transport system permease protein
MPSRHKVMSLFWQYGLLGAMLVVLGFGLLYPIFLTVRGGFAKDIVSNTGFTLEHVRLIFTDPVLLEGLFNSFKLALATTTLTILIALPLAVLGAGYRFPGKSIFSAAVLVPMILPPFVGAIGVRALLGREGSLNALFGVRLDLLGEAKFWGVVGVQALSLYPIIYLNAAAALANLDPALDEAAENLGASWWRRFSRITLPLIRPGLFAGATIVFIWSFTELGTPLMFDYYRVTPVQIFYGLREVENSAMPYALTVVMLSGAILLYFVGKFFLAGAATRRACVRHARARKRYSKVGRRLRRRWFFRW